MRLKMFRITQLDLYFQHLTITPLSQDLTQRQPYLSEHIFQGEVIQEKLPGVHQSLVFGTLKKSEMQQRSKRYTWQEHKVKTQGQNTHGFAWIDIRQVRFEFLNSPVLVTVDGLVTVFLVGSPDDKDDRTVDNTLLHDSKTLASSKKTTWIFLSGGG